MSARNEIEIDYCPNCRGVWLDRGELDKIIQKSVADSQSEAPKSDPMPNTHDLRDPRAYSNSAYKYKRKKSFLEELFD